MKNRANYFKVKIIIFSLLAIIALPLFGQRVSGQTDKIESGSSVFVFRRTRPETNSNALSKEIKQRSIAQKVSQRKKIAGQLKTLSAEPRNSKTTRPVAVKTSVAPKTDTSKVSTSKSLKNGSKNTAKKTATPEIDKAELAEAAIERGDQALEKEKPDEAITAYRVAIAYDPLNADAKIGLLDALVQNGDRLCNEEKYDKAISFYQEALRQNPNNLDAVTGIGNAYDGLQKHREAILYYEKALQLNPNLTELYLSLGVIYFEIADYPNAETYLKKALLVEPNKAEILNYLGLAALKQNREAEAIEFYNQAVAESPNSGEAYFNLSEVFKKQNRSDDFLAMLQKSIAAYEQSPPLSPRVAEVYCTLGRYFYSNGKTDEAIEQFKKANTANPQYLFAYTNLANIYRQQSKYAEAFGVYQRMTEVGKDESPAELAAIYSLYGFSAIKINNWAEAVKALEKAIELQPEAADYANLGWAYNGLAAETKDQTNYAKAEAILQKALAIDSNLAQAYLSLGNARTGLGKSEESLDSFRTAIKLTPKWSEPHKNLGLSLAALGKYQEALVEIKRADSLEANNSAIQFSMAVVQLKSGNQKDAQRILKILQKSDPQRANELENLIKVK